MKPAHLAMHAASRVAYARRALGAFSVLVAVLALPDVASAQRPSDTPNAPPFYAIQNARIVPVSGPVIESGTVVIANGLIEAVGANVTIPPEAWVIDGSGLTVYPGLFDGMSSIGMRSEQGGQGQEHHPRECAALRGVSRHAG